MQFKNEAASVAKLLTVILEKGLTPVFDLDGVLLDASHRQACNPDGTLNLEQYIKDAYYENVMDDKSLPLIGLVGALNNLGMEYHIATARPLCQGTKDKLKRYDVNYSKAIHRGGRDSGDNRRDSVLKVEGLKEQFTPEQHKTMMLIDDNLVNLNAVSQLGLATAYIPWNGH